MIHSFWVEGLPVENAERFRFEAKRKKGFNQDSNTTSVNKLDEMAVFISRVAYEVLECEYRVSSWPFAVNI